MISEVTTSDYDEVTATKWIRGKIVLPFRSSIRFQYSMATFLEMFRPLPSRTEKGMSVIRLGTDSVNVPHGTKGEITYTGCRRRSECSTLKAVFLVEWANAWGKNRRDEYDETDFGSLVMPDPQCYLDRQEKDAAPSIQLTDPPYDKVQSTAGKPTFRINFQGVDEVRDALHRLADKGRMAKGERQIENVARAIFEEDNRSEIVRRTEERPEEWDRCAAIAWKHAGPEVQHEYKWRATVYLVRAR